MTTPGTPHEENTPLNTEKNYPAETNPYQHNPYQSSAGPAVPPAPANYPPVGYPQAPGYQNQGYQQAPAQNHFQNVPYQTDSPYGYVPAVNPEGKSKADYAMIFGVVGIFFLSLVFGILALVYAKKAEELGADAKVGKILGWIDIALGVLGFLWIFLFVIAGAFSGASY